MAQETELAETRVATRAFNFAAIRNAPAIRNTATMDVWGTDAPPSLTSVTTNVSTSMWHAIQSGQPIGELIKASPEEVVYALKEYAVKRLGSFTVKDSDVLIAFGDRCMLTRGSRSAWEDNYELTWQEVIKDKLRRSPHKQDYFSGAWEQQVKVTAYVVNIKDAAAFQKDGLLHALVKKSQKGGAGHEIWSYLAVKAVIEYKWRHWARRLFLIEFGLYIGWVISFSLFLFTYTEFDLKKTDNEDEGDTAFRSLAYIFDCMTIVFMSPFMVIEYASIREYGMRWLQLWNVIDSAAYIFQVLILYGHLSQNWLGTPGYHTILAIHSVLLFVKIQYFARLLGSGFSFVELLIRVVSKVRGFFYFILLTMISVAMAFTVLFKNDIKESGDDGEAVGDTAYGNASISPNCTRENADENSAEDFDNIVRSMVTTYAVLLGDFNPDYVFGGTNLRWVKGIFFVGFQVVMSITVLNLLIAVITESYTYIMEEREAMFNMSKAQAMDELEIAVPMRWRPTLSPYCHFLAIAKEVDDTTEIVTEGSVLNATASNAVADGTILEQTTAEEVCGVKNEVRDLRNDVQELKTLVKSVIDKLDR